LVHVACQQTGDLREKAEAFLRVYRGGVRGHPRWTRCTDC
jgi:hypothetical protein